MNKVMVSTRGRMVIPSKIRQKLKINNGTRLCIIEEGNQLILQPLTDEYFEKTAGILNTKESEICLSKQIGDGG